MTGTTPRPRVVLGDPARNRIHQRRVERRAVAQDLLGELDPKPSVGVPRTSAIARQDLLLAQARRHAAVDPQLAGAGITLIFSEALMRVGVKVTPSIGSKIVPSRGSASRSRATAPRGSAGSSPSPARKALGSAVSVIGGLAGGHPLEQRGHLQQRVLAHPRHRGVAGHALGRDA